MKTLWAMALLLFPVATFASGYGGAEGRNRLGERIYIAGDSHYEIYVIKGPSAADWSKPYDMNVECPEFINAMEKGGVGQTFSCPSQRKFPLSGTTYRITTSTKYRPCNFDPYFDKTPGIVYLCVKGCNGKSAPTIFKESPWEC